MRPRLEPAPYTQEDSDIWMCVGLWGPFALNDKLELSSSIGDRRDADLMLVAQEIARFGPCAIELYGIACRGWDQAENGKLRGAL